MWSVPAKNMKKINMSISFVYVVSIQGNCENAVFTFLPFYKQYVNAAQQKEPFGSPSVRKVPQGFCILNLIIILFKRCSLLAMSFLICCVPVLHSQI